MSTTESEGEEAITGGEIASTVIASPSGTATEETTTTTKTPRNAFAELMTAKPNMGQISSKGHKRRASSSGQATASPATTSSATNKKKRSFAGRDGLGAYIADPAAFPPNRVIYYNDDFVAIRDMFPKSAVHCLLLPRKVPVDVEMFEVVRSDPAFLAAAQAEAAKLKQLVAKELERKFGRESRSSALRQRVLDSSSSSGDPEAVEKEEWEGKKDGKLPPGRDWAREVKVGIHSNPSMNHLHIHVLSRDMASDSLKHKKHYNSFNTDFFADLDIFPMDDGEVYERKHSDWSSRDLVCWRCGKNFSNKFQKLKEHLAEEFEEWKRE
ncbi:HIT domain-containing protein [Apiospora arundinis]|uniref:HIT domain-containing protein n=1 Tax=Apiospora arundinis TaxID=335852 RepID=A0ABR2HYP6_9PEZI